MTTPKAVTWQTILEKHTPELLRQVMGLRETVLADGALSVKTKTLMISFLLDQMVIRLIPAR